jgi:glycosyltransferase involved in cell wall biosynthesis
MKSGNTIGVVIPTYNRFIETVNAVESVLNQTLKVSQVIIVDDGSDLGIYSRLEKAIQNEFVELLRINHSGHPGIAREAGRVRLQTDWIAFLDSDDKWNTNKLERIFYHQKLFNASALCSKAYGLDFDATSPATTRYLHRNELFKANKIVNSSVVLRAELLEEIGGIATSYSVRGCEDYATWLRIADKSKWLFVSEPLIEYNNNSHDSIRKDEEFLQSFSSIHALLDYALYSKTRKNKRQIGLRVLLKHLWRFVK